MDIKNNNRRCNDAKHFFLDPEWHKQEEHAQRKGGEDRQNDNLTSNQLEKVLV